MSKNTYTGIYCCRMCGQNFETFVVNEENANIVLGCFEMDDISLMRKSNINTVYPYVTHHCSNGDLGLAYFRGFKLNAKEEIPDDLLERISQFLAARNDTKDE